MSDTIYRDDAKNAVMWGNGLDGSIVDGICEKIDAIPSADRPQGKWIFHSEWEEYWCRYECSLCGRTFDYEMNYCGFCGARMKGADDED